MAGVQFAKRLEKMEEALRNLELTPRAKRFVRLIHDDSDGDDVLAARKVDEAAKLVAAGVAPDQIRFVVRRIVAPAEAAE